MNGLGSITSHGFRSERRMFPACRSVANSTSLMGAVRGNSSKRRRPSRTNPVSGQRFISASVSLLQYSVMADRGRKACGADGERQRRRSSRAITTSCSKSGSARSGVPGSQRSRSIAPSSSSALRSRTVGSPFQKRSPWSSCSPSMCGIPSFNTALVPSAIATGATHAQLTSSPSKGAPSVNDHRRSRSPSASGKRLSHAARSGVLRQANASRTGTLHAMLLIVTVSLAV